MKKILCLCICFLMLISAAACQKTENGNEQSYDIADDGMVIMFAPAAEVIDEYIRITNQFTYNDSKIKNLAEKTHHNAAELGTIKEFIDALDKLMNELNSNDKFDFVFPALDIQNINELKTKYDEAVQKAEGKDDLENVEIQIMLELYNTVYIIEDWLQIFHAAVYPPQSVSDGESSQPVTDEQPLKTPMYLDYLDGENGKLEQKTAIYVGDIAKNIASELFHQHSWMDGMYTYTSILVFPYGVAAAGCTSDDDEMQPDKTLQLKPVFKFVVNGKNYDIKGLSDFGFDTVPEGKGKWIIVDFDLTNETFDLTFQPLDESEPPSTFTVSFAAINDMIEK